MIYIAPSLWSDCLAFFVGCRDDKLVFVSRPGWKSRKLLTSRWAKRNIVIFLWNDWPVIYYLSLKWHVLVYTGQTRMVFGREFCWSWDLNSLFALPLFFLSSIFCFFRSSSNSVFGLLVILVQSFPQFYRLLLWLESFWLWIRFTVAWPFFTMQMNRERLMKMAGSVRTGGKGTVRRSGSRP